MTTTKIKSVWLPEPADPQMLQEGAEVGVGTVTRIVRREENMGDHTVAWYDVWAGAKTLVKSFNARYVVAVYYYEEEGE